MNDCIGLRSATVDAYGTAGTLPRIARAIPTDEQAQIERLRESAQRAQDALTEKCGEVVELQQKLVDAELRIRTANDRARDAAQTAERALTRLVEQEQLVKAAVEWDRYIQGNPWKEHWQKRTVLEAQAAAHRGAAVVSVFRVQTIIEERPCNSDLHHVDLWVDGVRFRTTCNSAGDANRILQATLRALGLKP